MHQTAAMSVLVRAVFLVGIFAISAHAGVPPLRVHVACESEGRTKACPAFLLGFVELRKVLLASPRGEAEVVVYVTSSEVARVDRVHLRFVGTVAGAPQVIETDAEVDCRAADDVQRAQLEPAFLRGLALYLAARDPRWVKVEVEVGGDDTEAAAPVTRPYDLALELTGFGSWTSKYQLANGSAALTLARTTRQSRITAGLLGSAGITRQPPLVLDDGRTVSLDIDQWQLGASATVSHLASAAWSYGTASRIVRDDPKGQYGYQWVSRAAIEWDRFAADDPRGNRLAVLYAAGWEADAYRLRNVRGETAAAFPVHALIASGAVRRDALTLGLQLQIGAELLHPERRHTISAAPFVEWRLGDHVDLQLSGSITKRELPLTDPSEIDPEDYAQLARLAYAEPLAMTGTLSLTIHLDRTNGERNDRLSDL